jgi:biopolymer transport protein ExbB/TolQ
MDQLIHADIFFFITSIAVVLITAILLVVLVYLVRILRDVSQVTRKVKAESELISQDIAELRQNIKREGYRFKHFMDFFSKFINRRKKVTKKKII